MPMMTLPIAKLTELHWRRIAWALWLIPLLVITVIVGTHPEKHSVVYHYHDAVERWHGQRTLYDGPLGMNYLPTFVPLFMPYHLLPLPVADNLWRWTAVVGMAFGLWCFSRHSKSPDRKFAFLTVIGLPLCLGAMRNGQANAHLGAALLLTAVCLGAERWWLAALFASLTFLTKPIGLAVIGLTFVVFPKLWWRLGICWAGVLLFPFFFGSPDYVIEQYRNAFHNLQECAASTNREFADVNGVLRIIGLPVKVAASTVLSTAAGGLFAAFGFLALRPLRGQERVLGWLAVSAAYLMLFNPMNEANSYVILAPVLALWVWHFFLTGQRAIGWVLVAIVASMSLLPGLLYHWLGNRFTAAWSPMMTLVFLTFVIGAVRGSKSFPPSPSPLHPS